MGKPRIPLAINLCINSVNIAGCAVVVFRPELFGGDAIFGVALANLFSQVAGLALAVFLLRGVDVRLSSRYLRPFHWHDLRLALVIGIPSGANNLAYSSSQLVTMAIITRAGASMVAAKVYASNLITYVMQLGSTLATANVILTGYRVGNGQLDEAMKQTRCVTYLAVMSDVICLLALMTVRVPLLKLFTQNEKIIAIASAVMVPGVAVEVGLALKYCAGARMRRWRTHAQLLNSMFGVIQYSMVISRLSEPHRQMSNSGCDSPRKITKRSS